MYIDAWEKPGYQKLYIKMYTVLLSLNKTKKKSGVNMTKVLICMVLVQCTVFFFVPFIVIEMFQSENNKNNNDS